MLHPKTLYTENERLKLQTIAIDIGNILIEYVIRMYSFKKSNGLREAKEAYFTRHRTAVTTERKKRRLHGQKKRARLLKDKDRRAQVHADSYKELVRKEKRQYTMDWYLFNAAHPTRLGRQTGID